MHSFLDNFKKNTLINAVIYIIVGILLVLFPSAVLKSIVYIIALAAAAMGIIRIISFFSNKQAGTFYNFDFITGVFLLLFALILVVFARAVISIIPIIIGIILAITGALHLVQAFNIDKAAGGTRIFMYIYSALLLIAGLFIIFNPFGVSILLAKIIGVIFIITAIGELATYISLRKN